MMKYVYKIFRLLRASQLRRESLMNYVISKRICEESSWTTKQSNQKYKEYNFLDCFVPRSFGKIK